jgi:hypothetical protein
VAAHADQGDAPEGVVGPAVAAAIESVAVGAAEDAGMGAAPHRWARAASERSRWGLSPVVTSSWPAVSTPTRAGPSVPGRPW